MIMKTIAILAAIIFTSTQRLEASILYTFADTPSGVRLDYTGSLNTLALEFQGGLTANGTYIDILGVVAPGQQLYDFQNFRPSPLLPVFPGVSFRSVPTIFPTCGTLALRRSTTMVRPLMGIRLGFTFSSVPELILLG